MDPELIIGLAMFAFLFFAAVCVPILVATFLYYVCRITWTVSKEGAEFFHKDVAPIIDRELRKNADVADLLDKAKQRAKRLFS